MVVNIFDVHGITCTASQTMRALAHNGPLGGVSFRLDTWYHALRGLISGADRTIPSLGMSKWGEEEQSSGFEDVSLNYVAGNRRRGSRLKGMCWRLPLN